MADAFIPIVPDCHAQRLGQLVDLSWGIFRSRFLAGRHPILKEAPFQHHFANVISSVGSLFCISRDDSFLVDLETRIENVRGKSKYIDITCSFPNANVSCAIELKFKTAQQGAQDYGRVDAYTDIEALELVCPKHFTFGRFFMITDSKTFAINPRGALARYFACTMVTARQSKRHSPALTARGAKMLSLRCQMNILLTGIKPATGTS